MFRHVFTTRARKHAAPAGSNFLTITTVNVDFRLLTATSRAIFVNSTYADERLNVPLLYDFFVSSSERMIRETRILLNIFVSISCIWVEVNFLLSFLI